MPKKRRSLSPIFLGAGCGLVVGVILSLVFMFDIGPNTYHPISTWTDSNTNLNSQREEYTLHVNILGIWNYDKSSLDPDAFRMEMIILDFTPMVIVAVICATFGALAIRFIDLLICGKFHAKPDQ
jgi:hypothetical protein